MAKGWGKGWHLRKHFVAPDGRVFSFGKEVKDEEKGKRDSRKVRQRAATRKKPKKESAAKKKVARKQKGTISVKRFTVYKVVYEVGDKTYDISDFKMSKKEADRWLLRQQERYGDDLAGSPFMINLDLNAKKKRKGWVVIEADGTKHEFEGISRKDARAMYLRKISKTRLPRGTQIKKME